MNKVKITAMRRCQYPDLMAQYENPIEHACEVCLGQSWISEDGQKPEGLCSEAWKCMKEFVEALARGEGNFFDGWMKNPYSAMVSCNDGFRPVSFYLETQLNAHNKEEHPPMHTAEHILNATMVAMFGCPRSRNSHIEKKKSKCDYILAQEPSAEQLAAIEAKVNEVISRNVDVTIQYMTREQAAAIVDLSKLPEDVSDTLRIVRIGDYDACACIGAHVANTREIGSFKILSHSFSDGVWRLRWKVA